MRFFKLFQRATELVGTGRALGTAADAVELADDIIDVLSAHQLADALQIAVAATQEEHLLDDVVLIDGDVNQFRARALCLVLYMFRIHNS